jgi:hypothetical protein
MPDELWYVAYGSNMSPTYFASRLPPAENSAGNPWKAEQWVWLRHDPYFASSSQTWDGSPVAFVSLHAQADGGTPGRAYLIDRDRFADLIAAEHRADRLKWDFDIFSVRPESWVPLPTRAKYNAILRLPDIDDIPAFTISTSRDFERGRPSDAYLATLRKGLENAPDIHEPGTFLEDVIRRSLEASSRNVTPRAAAPLTWSREALEVASPGYPTMQLSETESQWLNAVGPVPGVISHGKKRAAAWLLPFGVSDAAGASPQVFRELGVTAPRSTAVQVTVATDLPTRVQRLPGLSDDIEIADRIQVSDELGAEFGRWALLVTPRLAGPVRLSPRAHVPTDFIRVAYAARELLGIDTSKGSASLVPLDSDMNAADSAVKRAIRWLLELWIGAPVVPLRGTEAVVGDEGHQVVRVDASALDFLGIGPGHEVVVSWARRSTNARALLQTDDLKERMEKQLEGTGKQSRRDLDNSDLLKPAPPHLQAWLSPSVRDALVIPPNSVVRLRRSLPHLLLRNLLALQLPIAGLVIAALAVPDVPKWVWLVVAPIAVMLAFIPLRLRQE